MLFKLARSTFLFLRVILQLQFLSTLGKTDFYERIMIHYQTVSVYVKNLLYVSILRRLTFAKLVSISKESITSLQEPCPSTSGNEDRLQKAT